MISGRFDSATALDSYRKSDAVVIVCQNNSFKTLDIAAANEEAARILGMSVPELVGIPLSRVIPDRIKSTIEEYVEFTEDGQDLLAVLVKVRNFSLKLKNGTEQPFRLRIIRGEEFDRNPWFHLVFVNEAVQPVAQTAREELRVQFKAQEAINEQTMLTNRGSIIKGLEQIVASVKAGKVRASFAALDINEYESIRNDHGVDVCNALHRHLGIICKQKLRQEDIVGSLSERSIGLALVDANQEEARMVLNRLRWTIGTSPLETKGLEIGTQVNVAFSEIDGKILPTEVLEKCEGDMLSLRKSGKVNVINLAVTHERRERVERRQQNIPVEIDRRRKDRRA